MVDPRCVHRLVQWWVPVAAEATQEEGILQMLNDNSGDDDDDDWWSK